MSLQLAAQHLASQGRGPDTTLVHMGQGEVNALQGLAAAHGGMLTTNPTTGLPEAGFLSSLLPMLGGAAISVGSGGAIDPFTAAMLIGGGTGLATGNLQKGLTAGLGAYGGAGIAGGLGAAGATGAQQAASSTYANKGAEAVGLPSLATASSQAATPVASTATTGSGLLGAPTALPGTQGAVGTGTFDTIGKLPPGSFQTNTVVPPLTATPVAAPVAPQAATQAATQAASTTPTMMGPQMPYEAMNPSQRFAAIQKGFTGENLLDYAQKNPKTTAAAFAPVFMDAMKPKKYKEEEEDSDPGQQYNYESNPTDPTPEPDPYGRGQTYFRPRYVNRAAGGVMRGLPSAQSNLGSYSDGGRLLRGPGDGVSDSIPAVIGGKQPARLADGEFVIPARIVSELGNGSTEAGAKQLYAMMDRIQRARRKTTGKKQVAKKTNARKLMPA